MQWLANAWQCPTKTRKFENLVLKHKSLSKGNPEAQKEIFKTPLFKVSSQTQSFEKLVPQIDLYKGN